MQSAGFKVISCDISPESGLALFGRGGEIRISQSLAVPLEANILISRDSAGDPVYLIALDTLFAGQCLKDALSDALIARGHLKIAENLVLVASHTHSAPALDDTKPRLGPMEQGYLEFVVGRISDALDTVQESDPQKSQLYYGRSSCEGSVYRRKRAWARLPGQFGFHQQTIMAPNHDCEINKTLTLICVGPVDDPLAVIWSWACHPVSEPDPNAISADFPGHMRHWLRAKLGNPNLTVLYMPGFSGDIRPDSKAWLPRISKLFRVPFATVFAEPSLSALARLKGDLQDAMEIALNRLRPLRDPGGRVIIKNDHLHLSEVGSFDLSVDYIPLVHLTIGGLEILGVGAEVSNGYLSHLPEPPSGHCRIETGCANHVFGYIPTEKQCLNGGYEGGGFLKKFSISGSFRSASLHQMERKLKTLCETADRETF